MTKETSYTICICYKDDSRISIFVGLGLWQKMLSLKFIRTLRQYKERTLRHYLRTQDPRPHTLFVGLGQFSTKMLVWDSRISFESIC